MPIIEFRCKNCGNKFEELIYKESEFSSIRCPVCQSEKWERLFSVFGLKGSGSNKFETSTSACTTCSRPSCAGCR